MTTTTLTTSKRYPTFSWKFRALDGEDPLDTIWKLSVTRFGQELTTYRDGYRMVSGGLVWDFFGPYRKHPKHKDRRFYSRARIYAKTPEAELWFMAHLPEGTHLMQLRYMIPVREPKPEEEDEGDLCFDAGVPQAGPLAAHTEMS